MRVIKVNKRKTAGVWKRILALMLVICCLPFGDYVQAFGAAMPETGQKGVEGMAESVPACVSGNFTGVQPDDTQGAQTNVQENGQADEQTDGNTQAPWEESVDSHVMEFEDMTVTEDLTLEADMETGNLFLMQGELNLNGYTLTVHGDCIQPGGSMVINGGKLITEGDYRIQTRTATEVGASEEGVGAGENGLEDVQYDYDYSTGTLTMKNSKDYVQVGGDFVTDSDKNHSGLLTNGVLEVAGDFTQLNTKSNYNFNATSMHKLYLTGNFGKRVSFHSGLAAIGSLEIAMEKESVSENGIYGSGNDRGTTGENITQEKGNDTVNENDLPKEEKGDLIFEGEPCIFGNITDRKSEEHPEITGIVRISSSTVLTEGYYGGSVKLLQNKTINSWNYWTIGGDWDCNGCQLIIQGNLRVEGELYSDYNLRMESGRLTVGKNLVIAYKNSYYGITMNNDASYIMVCGDFLYKADKRSTGIFAGTLEVKGNFIAETTFYMQGTSRLIFSGERAQIIKLSEESSKFHIVELRNYSEAGVYCEKMFRRTELIRNGCKITYGNAEGQFGEILTEDTVIEGDFLLLDDTLDLNGHSLTIKGDLIHQGGTVYIHGGTLNVEGSYRMQIRSGEKGNYTYASSVGILQMTDEADRVFINGDFYIDTHQSTEGKLINGILDLKGNLYQILNGSTGSFSPSGAHTLRLSGKYEQSVALLSGGCIHNLEVTNTAGIKFENNPYLAGYINIPKEVPLEGKITIKKETTFAENYIGCDTIVYGAKEFASDFVIDGNLA